MMNIIIFIARMFTGGFEEPELFVLLILWLSIAAFGLFMFLQDERAMELLWRAL